MPAPTREIRRSSSAPGIGAIANGLVGEFAQNTGNDLPTATALSTIARENLATNNLNPASQSLRLCFFTAPVSATYTGVRVLSGATAAGATPTLVRFGIYQEESNGDVTLIGSTPNDTTIFATQNTRYTKALSVATPLVAGRRYAFGTLVVSGATMPTFPGNSPGGAVVASLNSEISETPRIAANVAAQADLPASVVAASLSASAMMIYSVLTI